MSLLQVILRVLFPERRHAAVVRTCSRDHVLSLLRPLPLTLSDSVGLLPFRTPEVRALITEAKYQGNRTAQRLLGDVLIEYLEDWLPDALAYEARDVVLVPIPLSKKRYRERGYNQVEEILRPVAKALSLPLHTHVLKRTRSTLPQTTLRKEAREENMKEAFSALSPDPAYLYIVVDDVATTGATLKDAVRALKNAGATRIVPLAIAY